jgi:3-hydroxyisobutyrate dehydrogenase
MMNIGFIGLGMMGYPMAHLLAQAGHAMTVMDLNAAAASRFVDEHGAAKAAGALNDFAAADMVITMLPDSNAVEAVVLANDKPGLITILKRGGVVIDMSSSEPMRSRNLAQTLEKQGLDYLDAPVSGGVKRAVEGSLAIMVGGAASVLEKYRPILDVLGKSVTHVGAAGAGHAMKALNNYVSAAGLIATVEALHAGQAFGLDPATMVAVMNNSTGKNNTTENKVNQFMLSGKYDSGFSLALMVKDLGIAMGLGASMHAPMQVGEAVLSSWREANDTLGKGADHTEMYRFVKDKRRS